MVEKESLLDKGLRKYIEKENKTKKLYDSSLKPLQGKFTEYHKHTKERKREYTLLDGRLHGWFETWYEDGSKRSQASFYNGLQEGAYHKWDENGKKIKMYILPMFIE